jgi:opacity protein-like surface antigen
VSRRKVGLAAAVAAGLLVIGASGAQAEEIENKFRISLGVGGYSITDQAHSPSANVRTLLNTDGTLNSFLFDPRNDSGAFSDFGLEPQKGAIVSVSYGLSRLWFVEASAGYRRGNVGNIEVQANFDGVIGTAEQPFPFTIFNYNGGTMTQIPVQVTAGIRFRPKASFNPYLAAGFGYDFNSFKPSDDLNTLSVRLDRSVGALLLVTPNGGFGALGPSESLSGITVHAPSAPEWHFGGGLEYTVARHWALYLDARYTVYSGKFSMTVNGSNELGISVPADQRFITDPGAFGPFGPIQISKGGLIDAGSFVPAPGFPDAICTPTNHSTNCVFTGPPDGVLDLGRYYVHAGSVRYDNASYQLGFRYTF